MTDNKEEKPAAVAVVTAPFTRYTPEQTLIHKKQRDERRKAIRSQNADSKLMR